VSGSSPHGSTAGPFAGRPRRVAWVTNDLPPSTGGIQQFVMNLLERTADADTLVLGPAVKGDARERAEVSRHEASQAWRTERAPAALLPTPATARWLEERLSEHRPDVIVIASLWPLGLIAARLGRVSGARVLGLTHGAEAGLARWPLRWLLGACTRGVDTVTTISDFTSAPIADVAGAHRIVRLAPGVDIERFAPREAEDIEVAALRLQWGIPAGVPLVGCVARLVPRKGQDRLLDAWPLVLARHPDAHLVIVGDGALRRRLTRRAAQWSSVHIVGPVPWQALPAAYAALDVFAMPVRTRWMGLDVEGLGISFLEAQASGVPVIVGDSGGATETLLDHRCGTLVDGRRTVEIAAAVIGWLDEEPGRDTMRSIGPELARPWSWDGVARRLEGLLDGLTGT